MKHLRWPITAGMVALMASAFPVTAAEDVAARAKGNAQPIELKAGAIAKNPADYYGSKVRVTAEVEDVYSAHAFTLDEDQIFAGPDVLVLNPAPRRESKDDEILTVTGIIRQYSQAQLESEYKWFKNDALQTGTKTTDFNTRPVLIADSVRTATGEELVRTGDASMSAGDQPLGTDKKIDVPAPKHGGDSGERLP